MTKNQEIISQNLDHLGIVAGIIDEIDIVKIINEKLGTDRREKITSGQVVKALILNALGMVSRPLYMFPQFFEDKATEKLLGTGIKSEYLNDDKIGRVMDDIYKLGLTKLFIEIVLVVIKTFNLEVKYAHLDSTSFHLHGEYKSEENPQEEEEIMKERPILIKKGYSRDHRPDLKQCVLDLIVNNQEGIPLFMRTGDGNESDKAVFAKILKEFKKQMQLDSVFIADSALYSQENIQLMKELEWITRVPVTIKKAKELIQTTEIQEVKITEKMSQLEKERVKKLKEKGYKWKMESVTYGGIEQRWLIVESEARKSSDSEKLEKKIEQEFEKVEKLLSKLEREIFENSSQISYQLKGINKKLKFFTIQLTEILESTDKEEKSIFQFKGNIEEKTEEIERKRQETGRFILTTNILDELRVTEAEILEKYKEQSQCEQGFAFLKDPLFFADSFFVEKPERIETLLFLMSLSLLVYNLGQRELRKALKRAKTGVKNQLGKLTDRPTLRWIFQCFQGIHFLVLNGVEQVVNLTDERSFILEFLPASCQQYYL
jgi:transposase